MSIDKFLSNASKTIEKRSKPAEIDIENTYKIYAKSIGCIPVKLVLLRLRGFPDVTTLCPGGRILFIEFKKPGKKNNLSANQNKWRDKLQKLGFSYFVCDTVSQAKRALDEFLGEQP